MMLAIYNTMRPLVKLVLDNWITIMYTQSYVMMLQMCIILDHHRPGPSRTRTADNRAGAGGINRKRMATEAGTLTTGRHEPNKLTIS